MFGYLTTINYRHFVDVSHPASDCQETHFKHRKIVELSKTKFNRFGVVNLVTIVVVDAAVLTVL